MASDGTYSYEYDAEGNVTRRSAGSTYTEYHWDHRNRLVQVVRGFNAGPAILTIDYAYDAFNQLVGRIATDSEENATGTILVYDGGQVVLGFDEQFSSGPEDMELAELSHRYLWGEIVDQLFTDEQVDWTDSDADGEVLWAVTDAQGSVRDVIDSNGTLRLHRRFDAFGNIVEETHFDDAGDSVTSGQTGYVDEAFAYTARWFDPNTGLQNNLHRWYDGSTGSWLSEDPIGFKGDQSNLYRYVGNVATMYVDPSGQDREWVNTHPLWPHTFLRVVVNGKCYELHYSILGSFIIPCRPGGGPGQGYVIEHISSTNSEDQALLDAWQYPENNIYIPLIHDCNVVSLAYRHHGTCPKYLPRDCDNGEGAFPGSAGP